MLVQLALVMMSLGSHPQDTPRSSQETIQGDAMLLESIADEVALLQGDSLPNHVLAREYGRKLGFYSAEAARPVGIFTPAPTQSQVPGATECNGLRRLLLNMKPKQTLRFKIQSEGSSVIMGAAQVRNQSALRWEVVRSNSRPFSTRSSKFEIVNPTSDPQPVIILLYGTAGRPYRIEIERS